MFFRYVYDVKSWFIFYVISLGFIDLLIWLDKGIAIKASSFLYLNLILLSLFIAFLVWRFNKEMKFTAALAEQIDSMNEDWIVTLPASPYLRDEVIHEVLCTADRKYRQKLSECHEAYIIERDYMTSWVHEVKAPLTAMKLAIDANRNNQIMRKIEAEWLRVHLLIDRQLYIARLPSLESDYVLAKSNIQRLAAEEVHQLALWCMEKNIAVEFEGEDAEVMTDSKWCRFIFRQLLTNAVKYSPDGGTILISSEVTPTGHVVLTLEDQGPGIPPHEMPRIFDKGFTGGTGRIQNAATGLGLYLAQTVAGKIGITLTAHSERMRGTAMRMTFTTNNKFQSVRM